MRLELRTYQPSYRTPFDADADTELAGKDAS
jgi:hypothetical protein